MFKLYAWIHTIARSKEHVPMNSEWYLDIFNSTYFDVFMNFVDQKVFKKAIINQKHDFSRTSSCSNTYLINMLRGIEVEMLGLGVPAKYHNHRRWIRTLRTTSQIDPNYLKSRLKEIISTQSPLRNQKDLQLFFTINTYNITGLFRPS